MLQNRNDQATVRLQDVGHLDICLRSYRQSNGMASGPRVEEPFVITSMYLSCDAVAMMPLRS
jgi:hypothetical protein